MKTALTNLSNNLFIDSRIRLNHSALKFGIDLIYSYDLNDIKDTEFYLNNRYILDSPKGIGFWFWKTHIILETLSKVEEGDIVIYMDPGLEIIAPVQPILNLVNQSFVVLFGSGNDINAHWTKRDCFDFMNCDSELYWYSAHCDASSMIFRKCNESIEFVKEWQRFGRNKYIITDLPNTCGKENLPGFIAHRYDQSILSLLAVKYRLNLYRQPSQFGNHYKIPSFRINGEFNCADQNNKKKVYYYHNIPYSNSTYDQLFDHHRTKNDTKMNKNYFTAVRFKQFLNPIKLFKLFIIKLLLFIGYKLVKVYK